ncbi:DEAD/DEAH box helicase domain protein [Desulfitobacterium hafniense DCB-2]|uniref:DEAD-box ATP-dependent RNA helicase CshA n=3 Tax=root TaxID=1 RepID=A0A098B1U2_DESHA|nr:DEAD/DEAH box helicase [Desulfitobacterium hafniense]ACL20950.1 DEAD/DEAH box helicase domain protein [Desulfitobacterium hafniense DCB-2]MEA5023863.1 DEAD/DEAH box helicase [Desulfitobacterium hafniense]CDX01836.1 DEAD-box ATP-dependent RNA helicase CshA [Desulfitobacterium hafniense]
MDNMERPESFQELGIQAELVEALAKEGIVQPTEIQKSTIPLILNNRDVAGQSETGSGKTLAYLLPVLQKIDRNKRENQVLVLTPTHELALQVQRQIQDLSRHLAATITSAAIIGNVNIARQIEKLKEKPHIIVGSAGRILELIQKRKISAQSLKTIVLDEADQLLDERNIQTVKAVLKTAYKDSQILLFSATLSQDAIEQAAGFLKDPAVQRITMKATVVPTIIHQHFMCEQRDKLELLRKLVRHLEPGRALIFINKTEEIEKTVERLSYHGLDAVAISGASQKENRRQAMADFRAGKTQLLVASDLAARGLDIKNITHIFNLDIPEEPQLYLHRVGRTGRAGQSGVAVSLVTQRELPLLHKIENSLKISIPLRRLSFGKVISEKEEKGQQTRTRTKAGAGTKTETKAKAKPEAKTKTEAKAKTKTGVKAKTKPHKAKAQLYK